MNNIVTALYIVLVLFGISFIVIAPFYVFMVLLILLGLPEVIAMLLSVFIILWVGISIALKLEPIIRNNKSKFKK